MLKVQILVRKLKTNKRKRKELIRITRSSKITKLRTKIVIINLWASIMQQTQPIIPATRVS